MLAILTVDDAGVLECSKSLSRSWSILNDLHDFSISEICALGDSFELVQHFDFDGVGGFHRATSIKNDIVVVGECCEPDGTT